ncbi:MAG: tetratricopeptide repeat protein [Bacteroidales bacterium]|nr:tetratricopeptide repeat protein [Bacteroidales bacterium]
MKKKKRSPFQSINEKKPALKKTGVPALFRNPNFLLLGILLLTIVVFSNIIYNNFIYYDDDVYVLENSIIKDFSVKGIITIFTSFYYYGYIPITLFTYALEYFLWDNLPYPYLITNLLFHLINTILVYRFIYAVSKKSGTALIASLFFAIHPLHVESVVWIAERKDLLYALFYLLASISYIKYLTNNYKLRYLFYTLLLITISMLSKPAGVTFPALLLLLDYYFKREINKKVIAEKLFFLFIMALFGAYYFMVKTPTHIEKIEFTFLDRIFLGGYSFMFYTIKSFVPSKLSLLYPYPVQGVVLPAIYYIATVISIVIVSALCFYVYKNYKKSRQLIFGSMFFLIHISLVLHIVNSIGGVVVTADRYTYLPYIGLFFLAGASYSHLESGFYKKMMLSFLLICAFTFSYISHERVKVWRDGESIFKDAIAKYPEAWLAYNNIGVIYNKKKMYQEAVVYFDNAIKYNPKYVKAHYNRGNSKLELGLNSEAIIDFTRAIELDGRHYMAYYNRGLAKHRMDLNQEAIIDYTKAIELDTNYAEAYNSRGWTWFLTNEYEKAMADFDRAILLKPTLDIAYNNRGWLKFTMNDFQGALNDYDMALAQNPDFELPYINRGWLRYQSKDYLGALTDFNVAIDINPENIKNYLNRALVNIELGNIEDVCKDWKAAAQLGSEEAQNLFNSYCQIVEQ